jgi:AcrR family transcriptional regulator
MGSVSERVINEDRDNKVEERRKQILDAALVMIAQKGYHGTTMDDIVKESKLSKGTLYWYFGSKKEIILALLERSLKNAITNIEAALVGQNTFSEQLHAIIAYATNVIDCPPEEGSRTREMLINTEFWRQAVIDPEVNAKLMEIYNWQTGLGQKLVSEAIARGEIGEVDATAISDVIIAVLDGLSIRWLLNPAGMNLPRATGTFLKVLLRGLTPTA